MLNKEMPNDIFSAFQITEQSDIRNGDYKITNLTDIPNGRIVDFDYWGKAAYEVQINDEFDLWTKPKEGEKPFLPFHAYGFEPAIILDRLIEKVGGLGTAWEQYLPDGWKPGYHVAIGSIPEYVLWVLKALKNIKSTNFRFEMVCLYKVMTDIHSGSNKRPMVMPRVHKMLPLETSLQEIEYLEDQEISANPELSRYLKSFPYSRPDLMKNFAYMKEWLDRLEKERYKTYPVLGNESLETILKNHIQNARQIV